MGSSKRSKDKDRDRKKKKKDRSRSRERDRDRHSHRHHHKHKKHKRTREELSPSISLSDLSDFNPDFDDISIRKHIDESTREPPAKIQRRAPSLENISPEANKASGGGKEISLSIEETNKIRAKLGLKLLESSSESKLKELNDTSDYKPGEEIHRRPENLRDKVQVEKLREKIAAQREKRRLKNKLSAVKALGASDDDDESGAKNWVHKSRKMEKERREAEKKNKMLEELDAQFGIGDLVEEELHTKKRRGYSSNHLAGLKVQHDTQRFEEGRTTILTLKDSNILDGDEDTLLNVDLVDLEKAEKNVNARKKLDDEMDYDAPAVDEFGNIVQKDLLTKYDEEISGEKMSSFRIGNRGQGAVDAEKSTKVAQEERRKENKMKKLRHLTSLASVDQQLATEYLTPSELAATKFRKVKRKKKKKKMLTADDLLPLEGDQWEEGEVEEAPKERVKSLRELMEEEDEGGMAHSAREEAMEEEDDQDDAIELQEALARSRRAKLLSEQRRPAHEAASDALLAMKRSSIGRDEKNMTLNLTDEFCRSLGDIPTYGLAGNRADEDAILGNAVLEAPKGPSVVEAWGESTGTWEEVDIEETKVEIESERSAPILEEEPDTAIGVVNALRLAIKKGYMEKGSNNKTSNATLQHLRAVHYSIEDKTVDDDRRSRANDRYMGPTIDFKEKDTYRPDVILEYVDDEGRKLNSKEAFRYLSHKFHGKGSGKNKLEKRMKKWQEEQLLKTMSSSDTPLQTLERQREKQKQMGAAYLVLSGSKPQEALEVKK